MPVSTDKSDADHKPTIENDVRIKAHSNNAALLLPVSTDKSDADHKPTPLSYDKGENE